MSDWFNRLVTKEPKSAVVAKERLQLVLIHDRSDLNGAALEALKDDIIATISRHIDIDPRAVTIEVAQDGSERRLVADIPLLTKRRRS